MEKLDVIKGWSSDLEIYKKSKEILKNFHWDAVIAEKSYSKFVPEEAGLYIFSSSIKINEQIFRNPFYIGESDWSIRDRFKDHIHKEEWKKMYLTYGNKFTLSYFVVDKKDEKNILDWETALIKMFMPKHNLVISKNPD